MILEIYLVGFLWIAVYCAAAMSLSTKRRKIDCIAFGLFTGLVWPIYLIRTIVEYPLSFLKDDQDYHD